MKYRFTSSLVVLLLAVSSYVTHAQNLVPNPSFEDFLFCPDQLSQLPIADFWDIPTVGTADLLNVCSGNGQPSGVPTNAFGNQVPNTGQGYGGLYGYIQTIHYREYMQVQLTEPMVAGSCYSVSMLVSLGDNSGFACNNMGIHERALSQECN